MINRRSRSYGFGYSVGLAVSTFLALVVSIISKPPISLVAQIVAIPLIILLLFTAVAQWIAVARRLRGLSKERGKDP